MRKISDKNFLPVLCRPVAIASIKKIPLGSFGWLIGSAVGSKTNGRAKNRAKTAHRREARFTSARTAAVALLLATASCGWSDVLLQTHKSFGNTGYFKGFNLDIAYIYNNPRDRAYVGVFTSNDWSYFSDWHTESHFGVVFQQGPDDDIIGDHGGEPPPLPTPNPGKNVTVYQTMVPTYTKCNDIKLGGDQGCAGSGCSKGMARYSAHGLLASLSIVDTPLRYTPGLGPSIDFTVSYSQEDSHPEEQSDITRTTETSNLGPNWTCNWVSYVVDDPSNSSANVAVFRAGGGVEAYSGFSGTSTSSQPDRQSHAVLVRTSSSPIRYEKQMPDGSKVVYDHVENSTYPGTGYARRVYMTEVYDSTGSNKVTVHYDDTATTKIDWITDALGYQTTFLYADPSYPLRITGIQEPAQFAVPPAQPRTATFTYYPDPSGQLQTITDEIGIQSTFTYSSDGLNFITSLQTPYGTSQFSHGQTGTNRWIEMTDPLLGKERVEYRDNAPGIPASDSVAPNAPGIVNSGLDVANTFYWDKKAIAMFPPVNGVYDYTKAKITHWLYDADGTVSGIPSSEKSVLENRVWYTYAGQPDATHAGPSANPSQVARVLGDNTTQLSQFEYNAFGLTTKVTDPLTLGRVTSYVYDTNNIDLLTAYQRNPAGMSFPPGIGPSDKIASFTYNALHEPLTATDTAGQITIYGYNSYGQLQSVQNAKSEITNYGYGDGTAGKPVGYLTSITSPLFNGSSAVTNFAYDSANRVRTVTDSDSYTTTTDYDNLDRKTKITYPDATYEQFQYTDNTNPQVTTLDLTGSRDRRGLWTYRHYNANRQMDSITDPQNQITLYGWCNCGALETITDPKNQITRFYRDIQSRVYQKVFFDNTTINYLYEGQTAANTAGATSRLKSSTDAKNQTTNYTYFADDNVAQISYTNASIATPSVSFTYDPNYNRPMKMTDGSGVTIYGYKPVLLSPALGANRLLSIDAPLSNDTITFGYDPLGRVINRSINGTANSETWGFDSLGRLNSDANKLGSFIYSYVGVTSRLQTLTYPGGTTANYLYYPNLQDKRLQQIKNQTSTSVLLSQFDYTYDYEGEIKTWKKNYPGLSSTQRYDLTYDNADQLTNAPLKIDSSGTLVRQYIYGYDFAANRTSERVGNQITTSTPNNVNEITSQSGATNRTLGYDPNGSLTNDGLTRTFEWDGANRLVAVNYIGTTQRSEFSYDGLNRCVKIVEKTGSTVNSTRTFVWCGNEKCEFRNASNVIQLQLYAQGQYQSNAPYFYMRDHLGSIREMVDASGTAVARYDYDPWGRSTTVIGTNKPDFNFTGLYNHAKSGLDLAVYRAYDPDLGRWLNRDPIGEPGGVNLYRYVANDSPNQTDHLGLMSDQDILRSLNNDINPLANLTPGCIAALKELAAALADAAREFARYNPVTDWAGGHPQMFNDKPTIPGGHAEELQNAFRRIETAIRRVNQECKNCSGKAVFTPEAMMEMMQEVE